MKSLKYAFSKKHLKKYVIKQSYLCHLWFLFTSDLQKCHKILIHSSDAYDMKTTAPVGSKACNGACKVIIKKYIAHGEEEGHLWILWSYIKSFKLICQGRSIILIFRNNHFIRRSNCERWGTRIMGKFSSTVLPYKKSSIY